MTASAYLQAASLIPMYTAPHASQLIAGARENDLDRFRNVRFFASGRLALYSLLEFLAEEDQRGEVLLPAYHCTSMVEACNWSKLRIRYYKISDELNVDNDDLASQLSADTLAVVFVHYFGFPAAIESAVAECRKFGAKIVEDAAHVDVTDPDCAGPVGKLGDWVIASMRKFCPVYDGGCVFPGATNSQFAVIPSPTSSLRSEARSAAYFVRSALRRRPRPLTYPANMDHDPSTNLIPAAAGDEGPAPAAYADGRFTVSAHIGMTRFSRYLMNRSRRPDRMQRRRSNYERLARVTEKLKHARSIFPELPSTVSPYVFPMLLERPSPDFYSLRKNGIEALRWERLETARCSRSVYFRDHLAQIPCHEDLSADQMNLLESLLLEKLS